MVFNFLNNSKIINYKLNIKKYSNSSQREMYYFLLIVFVETLIMMVEYDRCKCQYLRNEGRSYIIIIKVEITVIYWKNEIRCIQRWKY